MKVITAVIQPFMLDKVSRELRRHGVKNFLIGSMREFDLSHDSSSIDSIGEVVKLEIFAEENKVDELVSLIAQTASTHQPGSGKIFVYELTSIVEIDTSEVDQDFLI